MGHRTDPDPARASLLARAFDYPYAPLRLPATYCSGHLQVLPRARVLKDKHGVGADGLIHRPAMEPCMPILAVGSNADRRVLFRKFGRRPGPLIQGPVVVHDHVCAHSAHIARYGALPATLVPHPGGQAHVWLQLVPLSWVADLDVSEAVGVNYERMPLRVGVHASWLPVQLNRVWTYVSLHGPLRIMRRSQAVLPMDHLASSVSDPAVHPLEPQRLGPQRKVLRHVAVRANWRGSLEDFVVTLVREPGFRRDVTGCLKVL